MPRPHPQEMMTAAASPTKNSYDSRFDRSNKLANVNYREALDTVTTQYRFKHTSIKVIY